GVRWAWGWARRSRRLYVIPQVGHGLTGRNYDVDGNGKMIPAVAIPNTWNRVALLTAWVERGVAPGISETVSAGEKSLPLCSYPNYPKYNSGPVNAASSYTCAAPQRRLEGRND